TDTQAADPVAVAAKGLVGIDAARASQGLAAPGAVVEALLEFVVVGSRHRRPAHRVIARGAAGRGGKRWRGGWRADLGRDDARVWTAAEQVAGDRPVLVIRRRVADDVLGEPIVLGVDPGPSACAVGALEQAVLGGVVHQC